MNVPPQYNPPVPYGAPYAAQQYYQAMKPVYFTPKRTDEIPDFQPGYISSQAQQNAPAQNEAPAGEKADFNEVNIVNEAPAPIEDSVPALENAPIETPDEKEISPAQTTAVDDSAENPAEE